jgi:hypothetical protein
LSENVFSEGGIYGGKHERIPTKPLNVLEIWNFDTNTCAGMKNINFLWGNWDCTIKITKNTMTSEVRQCLSLLNRRVGGVEFDVNTEWEIGEGWDNEKGISRII